MSQSVKLQVMDHDFGITHDDSLGTLSLPLNRLQPGIPLDEQHSLLEVNQGVIRVQMLYHVLKVVPSGKTIGKNIRGGGIRRNVPPPPPPRGGGGVPSRSSSYGLSSSSIPPPPPSSSSSSTNHRSSERMMMPVGTEKPTGVGVGDGSYNGGSYQSMGGQYQPTGGSSPYGLMSGGQPSTEDEDILFVVEEDDNRMLSSSSSEVFLSKGKRSEGVVGVDKDGDGTTDDFLLFTWEG